MTSVLAGFAVIAVIIGAGWIISRLGVLGEAPERPLSLLVFYLLTPALLLHVLATTDVSVLFSSRLWTSAVSATVIAVLYFAIAKWWLRRRTSEATVGALAASYVNSSNLGIPIAVFVLRDTSFVAPLLLFQILVFSTVALTILDVAERHDGGVRPPVWRTLLTPLLNPVVAGALIGLLISLARVHPPEWLMSPVKLLGDAAVPMALLVFGLSLGGVRIMQKGQAPRRDIALATALKMVAMPVLAWAIARFAFDERGHMLFAQTVTAALPTAQNVLVYALRYNRGVILARDAGLITTALSIPAIMLIAVLLT